MRVLFVDESNQIFIELLLSDDVAFCGRSRNSDSRSSVISLKKELFRRAHHFILMFVLSQSSSYQNSYMSSADADKMELVCNHLRYALYRFRFKDSHIIRQSSSI
jgi:hypothetical protein